MGTTEQNRQVVQEGLDKRKTKRQQDLIDTEQEVITTQMIDIVNRNAYNAKVKKQARIAERKRIAVLNKRNNRNVINLYASVITISLAILLYVVDLTKLWSLITSSVLLTAYFAFNIYKIIKNTKEITKLTSKES